jgi:hypothetical protein
VSSVYDPSAVQAQFTAFDPYAQQAQYEAMLQAEYARQQAEAAQQQQYYALQMQAAQFQQATQFQPLVPQKTAAVHGYVLICPLPYRTEALTWHAAQLKQPLCPSAFFSSSLTRTHARLFLVTSERICNTRPRAGSPTPTVKCLSLLARVLASPTYPHLISCGGAGRRS